MATVTEQSKHKCRKFLRQDDGTWKCAKCDRRFGAPEAVEIVVAAMAEGAESEVSSWDEEAEEAG